MRQLRQRGRLFFIAARKGRRRRSGGGHGRASSARALRVISSLSLSAISSLSHRHYTVSSGSKSRLFNALLAAMCGGREGGRGTMKAVAAPIRVRRRSVVETEFRQGRSLPGKARHSSAHWVTWLLVGMSANISMRRHSPLPWPAATYLKGPPGGNADGGGATEREPCVRACIGSTTVLHCSLLLLSSSAPSDVGRGRSVGRSAGPPE